MRRSITNYLQAFAQNRLVQHSLFWALSLYVLFRLFNVNAHMQWTDFYYTLLFHLSLVFLVYVNTQLLIPRLLSQNRYAVYLLSAATLIMIASLLNQFTFTRLTDWLLPGYYFISYYTFRDIVQFMLAFWAVSTILKLAKSWFKVNEQQKRIQELQQQKTEVELSALKAQINPHFLFNSLNNIYSLALYEDKKTPDALLQLSQCMRYVLYEGSREEIELAAEADFLKNYSALFLLRNQPNLDFKATYPDHIPEIKIAPLLLLNLLENAFKHLKINKEGVRFIYLDLSIHEQLLHFNLRNSYQKKVSVSEQGGVGFTNLQKRLQLLYPERHKLIIAPHPNEFEVSLSLNLST